MDRITPNHLNGITPALDNLYFLESLTADAQRALFTDLGVTANDGFRVTGAQISDSGDDKVVTDGWIVMAGELLQVDSHTATGPLGGGEVWYWTVEETNRSDSQDEDVDGNTIYVVKKRRAKLTRGAAPGSYVPMTIHSIWDKYRTAMNASTSWTEISKGASSLTGNVYWRYRNGCIEFKGSWIYVGGSTSPRQLTLPTGLRPNEDRVWSVIKISTAADGDAYSAAKDKNVTYTASTGVLTIPIVINATVFMDMIPPVPLE